MRQAAIVFLIGLMAVQVVSLGLYLSQVHKEYRRQFKVR